MEEVKQILEYYDLDVEMLNYERHALDPDMRAHTLTVNNKRYILVEVESLANDLLDEQYTQLQAELGVKRKNMKLITPKLEQMQTVHNKAGIGIDGHSAIINADDATELQEAQEKASVRYFPPVSDEEQSSWELKEYKNPHGLNTETTWVLFELQA